jgi:dihydropteroate synthase
VAGRFIDLVRLCRLGDRHLLDEHYRGGRHHRLDGLVLALVLRKLTAQSGEFDVASPELTGQPVEQLIGLGEPVAAQRHRQPHLVDVLGAHRAVGWQFPRWFIPDGRRNLLPGRQETRRGREQDAAEQDRKHAVQEQVQHPSIVPCQALRMTLTLGPRRFETGEFAVMAIVNRTPDSFYPPGRSADVAHALATVSQAVADGADIVDVGGVRAGYGPRVDVSEELDRVLPVVTAVREQFPDVVISVDTWRHEVALEVIRAGADLINDTWAGADPDLVPLAAETGVGLVCSHTGGLAPRTDPHRVTYDDVVADVIATVTSAAEAAAARGVRRDGVVVDPTHDFGKNTRHSLELTRRLDELVATGWPVLVALSRKDFIGETLDLPAGERLAGTLAATAISAWHGAQLFRTHDPRETRQVLDMVASIRGTRPPAVARRGLA